MTPDFALIITCHNDAENCARTVSSAYDKSVITNSIVVVDDFSGAPLKLPPVPCTYVVRTPARFGVSGARQFGIDRLPADAEWFALADSHMSFPPGWDRAVRRHISESDNRNILTGVYTVLEPPDFELTRPARLFGGAWHEFVNSTDPYTYRLDWSTFLPVQTWRGRRYAVPIMAGAFYVINRWWYDFIKGWDGFAFYGSEEACLCRKGWLAGGETILMADVLIGHRTQPVPAGRTTLPQMAYNQLHSLACTCDQDEWEMIVESVPHAGLLLPGLAEFERRREANQSLYDHLKLTRKRTNDDWCAWTRTKTIKESVRKYQESVLSKEECA